MNPQSKKETKKKLRKKQKQLNAFSFKMLKILWFSYLRNKEKS